MLVLAFWILFISCGYSSHIENWVFWNQCKDPLIGWHVQIPIWKKIFIHLQTIKKEKNSCFMQNYDMRISTNKFTFAFMKVVSHNTTSVKLWISKIWVICPFNGYKHILVWNINYFNSLWRYKFIDLQNWLIFREVLMKSFSMHFGSLILGDTNQ